MSTEEKELYDDLPDYLCTPEVGQDRHLKSLQERCPATHKVKPIKPTDWIVKDWLELGELHLFIGSGGEGKSRLVMQLADAICRTPEEKTADSGWWIRQLNDVKQDAPLELQVEPKYHGANVLYAFLEDGEDKVNRRINLINPSVDYVDGAEFDEAYEKRYGRLFLQGEGSMWSIPKGEHRHTNSAEFTTMGKYVLRQAIGEIEKREGYQLLVIDTLGYAFADDENNRHAVSEFCGKLSFLSKKYGFATLIVSHPPKNQDNGFWSGSSAWQGNVRGMWTLGRESISTEGKKTLTNNPKFRLAKSSSGQANEEGVWLTSTNGGRFHSTVDAESCEFGSRSKSNGSGIKFHASQFKMPAGVKQ